MGKLERKPKRLSSKKYPCLLKAFSLLPHQTTVGFLANSEVLLKAFRHEPCSQPQTTKEASNQPAKGNGVSGGHLKGKISFDNATGTTPFSRNPYDNALMFLFVVELF